ncbi:hypothetical protein TMatcc_007946 [Talaromyces marneffei ATCC 18224]|uniref:uncharacterized protein n=1 Tax=Talaromyces marneffei TaxID=37727 RepID=UPI0012A9F166|nr:uncharacterized protein EYB26_004858 [Talaromyces marneffei]KAE8552678.1 hypothetical protein EYB25_004057 [Talaromyces marneffei]QGA17188.1 hypothetical protein EYB26_004858 [Talaromyces marneffei]
MSKEASGTRNYWTVEEDEMLRRNSTGTIKNWNEIALKLPGRSNKDCRKRWSKVGMNVNRGHWSVDEDNRLRKAVELHGYSWTTVAREVETRHADQCAKRWCDFLDPALSRKEWSGEEYDRLLEAVQTYGRSWKLICEKVFPNRSATDIKNRYAVAQKRCENNLEFSHHDSRISEEMGILSLRNSCSSDSRSDVLSGVNLPDMNKELDYPPQLEAFPSPLAEYSAATNTTSLPRNYTLAATFPDFSELAIPYPATEPHIPSRSFDRSRHDSSSNTRVSIVTESFVANNKLSLDPNIGCTTPSTSSVTGSFIPHGSFSFFDGDHQTDIPMVDTTATSDLSNNDEKSRDTSPNTYTVLLEDVQPEMLRGIMNVVVGSKEIVKMKITSSETDQ